MSQSIENILIFSLSLLTTYTALISKANATARRRLRRRIINTLRRLTTQPTKLAEESEVVSVSFFRFLTNKQIGNAKGEGIYFNFGHAGILHDFGKLFGRWKVHNGIGKVIISGGVFRKYFGHQGKQIVQINIIE